MITKAEIYGDKIGATDYLVDCFLTKRFNILISLNDDKLSQQFILTKSEAKLLVDQINSAINSVEQSEVED